MQFKSACEMIAIFTEQRLLVGQHIGLGACSRQQISI